MAPRDDNLSVTFIDYGEVSMKDDPNEAAMAGSRAKPSIPTIASIFLAAIILGVLLLMVPRNGILSETHVISHSFPSTSEH